MKKTVTPIYFDSDAGIDDALALSYLAVSPRTDVVGVGSVSGNVDAKTAARNCLNLLAMAGLPEVPVAEGSYDWLTRKFDGGAPWVHGDNGVGQVKLEASPSSLDKRDAVSLLIDLSHEYKESLCIVAVGPLTNIAAALEKDPTLPERIARVVVMGGAVLAPGNVTPVAEANFANDPEAAKKVFEADWMIDIAPLDATMTYRLNRGHLERMRSVGHPLATALADMFDFYFKFYIGTFEDESAMHDPLAAAIACDAIEFDVAPLVCAEIDATDGPGRGQLICDMRGIYSNFSEQTEGAHVRPVLSAKNDPVEVVISTIETLKEC